MRLALILGLACAVACHGGEADDSSPSASPESTSESSGPPEVAAGDGHLALTLTDLPSSDPFVQAKRSIQPAAEPSLVALVLHQAMAFLRAHPVSSAVTVAAVVSITLWHHVKHTGGQLLPCVSVFPPSKRFLRQFMDGRMNVPLSVGGRSLDQLPVSMPIGGQEGEQGEDGTEGGEEEEADGCRIRRVRLGTGQLYYSRACRVLHAMRMCEDDDTVALLPFDGKHDSADLAAVLVPFAGLWLTIPYRVVQEEQDHERLLRAEDVDGEEASGEKGSAKKKKKKTAGLTTKKAGKGVTSLLRLSTLTFASVKGAFWPGFIRCSVGWDQGTDAVWFEVTASSKTAGQCLITEALCRGMAALTEKEVEAHRRRVQSQVGYQAEATKVLQRKRKLDRELARERSDATAHKRFRGGCSSVRHSSQPMPKS